MLAGQNIVAEEACYDGQTLRVASKTGLAQLIARDVEVAGVAAEVTEMAAERKHEMAVGIAEAAAVSSVIVPEK